MESQMNFSAGSHLERAITHLKNGSVRETISSLNEFNAKNKSTFKFQESEFQRKVSVEYLCDVRASVIVIVRRHFVS
jgi:hypothetical protein